MLHHTITPDVPSNEFDAIEDFASRVIRQALHESPLLLRHEVLTHPTVKAAMSFIEQQFLTALEHPHTLFSEHVQNEYARIERWSLNEAVSLCAAVDPLYYTIRPLFYNVESRNHRLHVKMQLLLAIYDRQLPCTIEGAHFTLAPSDFCDWALANNLADTSVVDFFTQIKSLRPERIFDACADVPSPRHNAHL